jgi:hypothetical protein
MTDIGPGNLGAFVLVLVLLTLLVPTVIVALFANVILVVPVRDNPKLYVRRRFMCWLGVCGFFIGSSVAILTARGAPLAVDVLIHGLIGLALGIVAGNTVGRVAWLWLRPIDEG